jgi:hypothetical protein
MTFWTPTPRSGTKAGEPLIREYIDVRRAKVVAVAAVAAAALGLTACSSNAGQAAVVGGQRISETTVANYLNPKGPTAAAVSAIVSNGGTFQSRSEALTDLIREKIFELALRRTGKFPSEATIAKQHDLVASQEFSSTDTGAKFDQDLTKQVVALGFRPSFTQVLVRSGELQYLFIKRIKPKSNAVLNAKLRSLGITVTVSPRYGRWNATGYTLTETPQVGLPGFVTFATTAPPAGSTHG